MSILSFLLKPKKEMAKKNTKQVKVWKYTITQHAQNRMTEDSRNIGKIDILDNLFTKPNGITIIKYDQNGRPSYNRIGKRATVSINPINNLVTTCRPISKKEIKIFNLVNISKKGRKKKYVKRNSKK